VSLVPSCGSFGGNKHGMCLWCQLVGVMVITTAEQKQIFPQETETSLGGGGAGSRIHMPICIKI
jgi:hypothetical protein